MLPSNRVLELNTVIPKKVVNRVDLNTFLINNILDPVLFLSCNDEIL